MSTILIKDILYQNHTVDVLIKDSKFAKIAPNINEPADTTINGKDKAILPAFYNMHTHTAMNLFKGISDDKELFDWLNNDIWPREEKLTPEMIYHGARLGILEMIKTGTVGYADMYSEPAVNMQAASEMGVRAAISLVEMDMFDSEKTKAKVEATELFIDSPNPNPELIQKSIAVHAVYSASEQISILAAKTAKENNMMLHIHACETQKEVDDCVAKYNMTPIEVLDKLDLITDKTILAHSIFLNDNDINIILRRKATLCTNPSSNLKLCSGMFNFQRLIDSGVSVTLGTDSSASNNDLNMLEEMKICSLVAKIQTMNPRAGKAEDVFRIATLNGAKALGIDAGVIAEGKLADCILVDLNHPLLTPNYNIISNMVYSADSSVIDTVICNGKILMQDRYVKGEEEIIATARKIAKELE